MNEPLTTMECGMQRRTELLLGTAVMEHIRRLRVLIIGVGGVGSWCAESLVRSGVREMTILDSDSVCITNCNRQLMATGQTLGQVKVEALRERLLTINPEAKITALQQVYNCDTADSLALETYDYIVDAIDSLRDKADLILRVTALPKQVTLISSMGAARRIDSLKVRQAEFWNVKGDALARALRERFKKQKQFPHRKFQCIYSEEPAMKNLGNEQQLAEYELDSHKAQINGSLCHVTATFGMAITGLILKQLLAQHQ